MREETKQANAIIRKLYKFSNDYPQTMFSDEAWQGVKKFYDDMITAIEPYIADAVIGAGEYDNYFSANPCRNYKVTITLKNGETIEGNIKCNAAGTVNDPFKWYDITTSWWRVPAINENRLRQIVSESIKKVLKENL